VREKGDISKQDGAVKHSQVDFLRLVVRDLKKRPPYFAYNARSLSGDEIKNRVRARDINSAPVPNVQSPRFI